MSTHQGHKRHMLQGDATETLLLAPKLGQHDARKASEVAGARDSPQGGGGGRLLVGDERGRVKGLVCSLPPLVALQGGGLTGQRASRGLTTRVMTLVLEQIG